jgi:branched-chain amino acid transport system substrate-binding protein
MRMLLRWQVIGLLALGSVLLLAACASQPTGGSSAAPTVAPAGATAAPATSGGKEVKIGFFGPLTGDAASDGTGGKNAAQMAIDELNAANAIAGTKLTLVPYDDQNAPEQASAIAQKLIDQDKVVAVVDGSYSTPSRAAGPIFQRAKIPMVVDYAVSPDITKAGDEIFRIMYVGPVQGKAMADYMFKTLNAKSIAVLNVDNDYGTSTLQGFTDEMKALGGTIPVQKTYSLGQKDFSALVTAVKGANPDALALIGYYAELAPLVQQAKAQGIATPILASDGADSPSFPELAGKDAEGVYLITDFSREDPRPTVQNFIKNYNTKFGRVPDFPAASGYDGARVIVDAMKRGGVTPDQIKTALAQTKGFDGVTGQITFTPDREVNKTVLVAKVVNSQFVFQTSVNP